MDLIVGSAGQLKPEARLGQAVVQFEAALTKEQKASFEAGRIQAQNYPPGISDVMRLTAEIDFQGRKAGRRCFGPRMTKVLESVQQFASIGDVIIGGSQNLVACGVWSLVRVTLLTAARFSTYLEELSSLLMEVGSSAPRYHEMVALHPKSRVLRTLGLEYFIIIVQLCREAVTVCNNSVVRQLQTFFKSRTIETYRHSLLKSSSNIREQLALEETRENSKTREFLNKFSAVETHQAKMKARIKLLSACSRFDYQRPWKQARKCGISTWMERNSEYKKWRDSEQPSTVLLSGKLGAGKTVLLANMIDDLNRHSAGRYIAYFFCLADDSESQRAHTLAGCVARQVIEACNLAVAVQLWKGIGMRPLQESDFLDFFRQDITGGQTLFLVVDGIDQCSTEDRRNILDFLEFLQDTIPIKLCVSYRLTGDSQTSEELERLNPEQVWEMPDENPDIDDYIQAQLEASLESGRLVLGDPKIILEIQQALETGAQGMFLWVNLQLQTICAQKTDFTIRKALRDLPKSLPETFSQILDNARENGPAHQDRLLKIIVAALRPLYIEEIREAMSVTHLDTRWDASKLINNARAVLASGGSLIYVDEEDDSVRFVHHSVEQFLLGDLGNGNEFVFTREDADLEMAHVVLTYLNYDVFKNQVSTKVHPSLSADKAPTTILASVFSSSSSACSVALRLLRSKRKISFDVGHALSAYQHQSTARHTFHFLQYAEEYFIDNTRNIGTASGALLSLLRSSLEEESLSARLSNYRIKPWELWGSPAQQYLPGQTEKDPYGQEPVDELAWRLGIFQDAQRPGTFWTHIGVFRSQLRHPVTGIRNICQVVRALRKGLRESHLSKFIAESPWLLLRFLWLAASFKEHDAFITLLALLRSHLSQEKIREETVLVDETHPALSIIADVGSNIPPPPCFPRRVMMRSVQFSQLHLPLPDLADDLL